MPLKRLVLLHTIILTSLTLPTELKNSSRSLARILWESCMTKTVLASLSSGLKSSKGEEPLKPKGDLGLLGNGGLVMGEGDRFLDTGLRLSLLRLLFSRRFLSLDLLLLSRECDCLSFDLERRSLDRDLRRSRERFLSGVRLRFLSLLERRLSRDLLLRLLLELLRFLLVLLRDLLELLLLLLVLRLILLELLRFFLWKERQIKKIAFFRDLNTYSEERCFPTSPFSLDLPMMSSYEQHKVKRTRRWGKTDNINKI